VCIYKEGEPYSGTKFEWDSEYDGITELSSYKDGQLDGESIEYTYSYTDDSYTTGVLIPEFVYNYKNGVKEGPGKQYFQGKLIRSMNYSNDMLEGEYKSYDMEGNLLSTVVYKEDYPYEGTVCDYDYSSGQTVSLTNYSAGNLNGEQKYYSNGALNRIETYDNGTILKEVSYLMGFEFVLTYENSLPYEGKKIDPYYYSISEYHEGNPVSVKTYTGDDYTSLESIETFQGEKSTKVTYFPSGQKKEEAEYENSQRSGKSTFYSADGNIIASGIFETDVPVSGSCVFYSTESETDYLIMQIDNTNFKVTEYINGKPGRVHQYSNPDIDSNSMVEEVQKFITIVQSIFENYSYPFNSEW
jgi:antitoxin component YwqK of YwqJK toxin-antitoxin module